MRPRDDEDDGPFRSVFFQQAFSHRRIFPWMGGDDDTEDNKPTAYESSLGREDRGKE